MDIVLVTEKSDLELLQEVFEQFVLIKKDLTMYFRELLLSCTVDLEVDGILYTKNLCEWVGVLVNDKIPLEKGLAFKSEAIKNALMGKWIKISCKSIGSKKFLCIGNESMVLRSAFRDPEIFRARKDIVRKLGGSQGKAIRFGRRISKGIIFDLNVLLGNRVHGLGDKDVVF